MMVHTTELERETTAGATYIDCFRKTDLRRTEIVCILLYLLVRVLILSIQVMMVFAMQLLSGENLIGQGVQFLQQAGLSTTTSFDISMVLNSMFIIGTIFSWGRKSIFLSLFTLASLHPVFFSSTQHVRPSSNLHLRHPLHGDRSPHHRRSRLHKKQHQRNPSHRRSPRRSQLCLQRHNRSNLLHTHSRNIKHTSSSEINRAKSDFVSDYEYRLWDYCS